MRAMNSAPVQSPDSFYRSGSEGFLPTALSRVSSPSKFQHDAALGLLMAQTLEDQIETGRDRLARFTLDMLHPAPAEPTTIEWRVRRAGRRVRLLEGQSKAGEVVAAQAIVLVVTPSGRPPPPQPLMGSNPPLDDDNPAAPPRRLEGLDVREAGRAIWVRMNAQVTPGAHRSLLATALAAAHAGTDRLGALWPLGYSRLDMAVHFSRGPRGEWVKAETTPMLLGDGIGVVDHALSDAEGPFARAHQTVLFGGQSPGAAK